IDCWTYSSSRPTIAVLLNGMLGSSGCSCWSVKVTPGRGLFGRPGQPPSETTAQRHVVVVEVRAQGVQEVPGQRRDRLRALVEPLPGRRPEVRVDVELLVERTECL